MKRIVPVLIQLIAAAIVVAGIIIEGTHENPWNLAMPVFFSISVLTLARRKPGAWVDVGLVPVVLGASSYGVGWTLGSEHIASPTSLLVYVGIAVLIAAPIRWKSEVSVPIKG